MTTEQRATYLRPTADRPLRAVEPATPARVPSWLFIAVFAVALGSLGVAQRGTAEIEMTHDGAHYLQIARSILRGEGFVTYTHWALNLPNDELPSPDTYRAPLYPLMVAAVAALSGDLASAGLWAAAIGGAFIPPLVLLLTVRRLGLHIGYGLVAALIALVNHHLMIAGSRALTEAPYTAAALASLLLMSAPKPRAAAAGVAAGVAWLFRYQGVLLIPCGLAAMALERGSPSQWMRRSALFCAAFLATIAPWLIRNEIVAGSPFYTELKYHVVSTYDPDRSFYQYFHGLTPPSEPISYMIKKIDRTVLLFGHRLWLLVEAFGRENAGNPLLLGFGILGAAHIANRRRWWRSLEPRAGPPDLALRSLQLMGIFIALNVAAISLTFAKHRHLTSCDPLVAVLGAAGLSAALGWAARRTRGRSLMVASITGALALGILTEGVRSYRKITRIEPRGLERAHAAAAVIGDALGPNDAVMAASPYFLAYALDRPAVSLPWADDEGFRTVALRHDVRFVCIAETNPALRYPGGFMETGVLPPWMYEVGTSRDGDVTVFGIDIERAALADRPAEDAN